MPAHPIVTAIIRYSVCVLLQQTQTHVYSHILTNLLHRPIIFMSVSLSWPPKALLVVWYATGEKPFIAPSLVGRYPAAAAAADGSGGVLQNNMDWDVSEMSTDLSERIHLEYTFQWTLDGAQVLLRNSP